MINDKYTSLSLGCQKCVYENISAVLVQICEYKIM